LFFHPLPEQECVHISGLDISDQKELEEKSLESEEKYQKLFNLIEQAVEICEITFDEKGQPIDNTILDVNLAYEKHSGLRREQVIGRSFKEIFPTAEQKWLDRY
jgi:PAS domain S-box-containing protein